MNSWEHISVTTGVATSGQSELARAALVSQRRRLVLLFRELPAAAWAAPTRCEAWTVHEVVRHLCDVTTSFGGLLRGASPEQAGFEGFDPRTTPVSWLRRSGGESPADTAEAFERVSDDLLDEVNRRADTGADDRVRLPYGDVPWSTAVLHVFWDAWLHERDIVLPMGRAHASPPVESRAAAAHGLIMSGVPFTLLGTDFDQTVILEGDGGGRFRVQARGDAVTVSAAGPAEPDDAVRGVLPDVVDSLMGRGTDPNQVLCGPADRIEQFATLRRFILTPAVRLAAPAP